MKQALFFQLVIVEIMYIIIYTHAHIHETSIESRKVNNTIQHHLRQLTFLFLKKNELSQVGFEPHTYTCMTT